MNTKQNILFLCAVMILCMLLANVSTIQAQNSNPVGAIPGVIDVSPMGAATYTIPIEVVPGTQGMQPNLSIVYNSMGGIGLLGMKWNLTGMSAITRCGQTPYYDNNISGINYGNQSRFALDGERLINISGNYNANGTVYATEMENFTRVVSHGYIVPMSLYIPESFTVSTDDGTIIEYGSTENSRLIVDNDPRAPRILSWCIDKITDINGNYMTFHYGKYSKEIWIDSIKYTGNSNITPYAKVQFNYTDLPDTMGKNTCFVGGYGIPQTKLLKTISVFYNNSNVRKYDFNYNIGLSAERTTHLKEIVLSEYDETGTAQQLDPTIINWGTQNNNIEVLPQSIPSTGSIVTGDFNGDGYTDYVVYNQLSGAPRKFQLYIYNPANSTFEPRDQPVNSSYSYAYSCDFDGDDYGRDELVLAELFTSANNTYKIGVWHYDNNWTETQTALEVPYFYQAYYGDFTGEGKATIMGVSREADGNKWKYTFRFFNDGFSIPAFTFYDLDRIQILDYNGNGKANIQIIKGNDTETYEYSESTKKFEFISRNFPMHPLRVYFGDFNGDGITDILSVTSSLPPQQYVYYNKIEVKFGTGDGYYQTAENELFIPYNNQWEINGPDIFLPKYNIFIADINGDGKDEIIQTIYESKNKQTEIHIGFFKGYANGKFRISSTVIILDGDYSNYGDLASGALWHLGDFNCDGKNDLLIRKFYSDTQPKKISFNKNEQYEYVKEIIDGIGKKTAITYSPKYLSFISSSLGRDKKAFVQLTQKKFTGAGASPMTIKYTYDNYTTSDRGRGKIYQIFVNNAVEETYLYDNKSRLYSHEKKISNNSYTFHYGYTPTGQLEWLDYPDGFGVNYSYSATGKLKEIRTNDWPDNELIYKVVSRNKFNAPTLCEYGNGVATEYTYNKLGQLTRINTGNKKNNSHPQNDTIITRGIDPSSELIYHVDSAILMYRFNFGFTHPFKYITIEVLELNSNLSPEPPTPTITIPKN